MDRTQVGTASRNRTIEQGSETPVGELARERLIAGLPVKEQRLLLAGMSTAVLEGGQGSPVVLLHGPMGYAAHWMGVIPGLVADHRVIVPDLPGHGASDAGEGELDGNRTLAWLGELIAKTCASPPVVVGQLLGGAIAARFAVNDVRAVSRLVLVDTFGLVPFGPVPEFGLALTRFLEQPSNGTHESLWRHCAFDLDRLHRRMGAIWEPFEAYNVDRASRPAVQAAVARLMALFGAPAIPARELAGISVPTSLVWGRHDRATPLSVAEAASARFGWPLTVIEDCADDPPVEQPQALLTTLRADLGST